ncbi:hypothetical protein [Gandjariella thermophila]|uniref:Uncharacterized protein n=1 Tax=Gandjariella thermophila TaxID=1931992 RepID=A0A4D4JHT0_9PSEU|nr:hypothetical protein [Gandjariella thermophila]GDY33437.1 hypothetical protein GTS_50700 [Gandjariella thermophila]
MPHPDFDVSDAIDELHSAYAFRLGFLIQAVANHLDGRLDGDLLRGMLVATEAHIQQAHAEVTYAENILVALRGRCAMYEPGGVPLGTARLRAEVRLPLPGRALHGP